MVQEASPQFIKREIRQEQLVITPRFLYDDNRSQAAEEARAAFEEKARKGELSAVEGCSDARTLTSTDISIRNTAGASEPSGELASHRSIRIWVADSHYDSDTLMPGVKPTGCGGLHAKEGLGENRVQAPGVLRYAGEKIRHPDPVLQAVITAQNIAALSGGKPVLATAQDHLTFHISPLAFFQMEDGEEVSRSAVQRRYLDPASYDPKVIYAEGLPTLREDHLPDSVLELLERHRKLAREIQSKYPDLRHLQKQQKPRMILVTTDRRSARQKFPETTRVPGSIFKINLARERTLVSVRISPKDIEDAIDQLTYPIRDNAIENHDDPTKPFSNTDRLIIETPDLGISRTIANRILREDWMRQWLSLHGRSIILLQTNDGVVNDVDERLAA